MLEELLKLYGNIADMDAEDLEDFIKSNPIIECSFLSAIAGLPEIRQIYDALKEKEAYEELLEIGVDCKQEFAEKYPKEAFFHGIKIGDDDLTNISYRYFSRKYTEEDLLEFYCFLLENKPMIGYSYLEEFVRDFNEEILGSKYLGEFCLAMFDHEEKFLANYLSREMLDDLNNGSLDYDLNIILAEIYDLAEMGGNDEVINELEDTLNQAIEEGLGAAWDEIDPKKKEIINTVYDLASKVENHFGVRIPQKDNVIIGDSIGNYGSIFMGDENEYVPRSKITSRAAA